MSQDEPRRFGLGSRMLKVALPTAAALGAGGALAAAGVIPSADGVISACYDTSTGEDPGDLRVVDDVSQCDDETENPLEWNQQGPRGPQGIPGPAGAQGTAGASGAAGAPGAPGASGAQGPAGPSGPAGASSSGGAGPTPDDPLRGFPATIVNNASTDIFVKYDGIKAESKHKGYESWGTLRSFAWGATNAGAAAKSPGASGGAKAVFSSFFLTKAYDETSVGLLKSLVQGKSIKSVDVAVRRGTQNPYTAIEYEFDDVRLDGYSQGGDILTDSLSFTFSKVRVEYFRQNAKGTQGSSVEVVYDVKTGKVS